jgi:cysteine-S-conjugate beta-lyase
VETNGRYRMDLEDMKRRITPKTKIVFFCNPHNPGGTAWSAEEIRALAQVCKERDLLLVSDEIHCDLLLGNAKHTPALAAAPDVADRLITCLAATKTFNLAGAHVGACVTSNADLKKKLDAQILACGLSSYNSYGMIATEAGWRTGDAWLNALLAYLTESHTWFDAEIARVVPGARSMRLDATYLAWVDFSGTKLAPEQVNAILKDRCRIFASPGGQFGPGGASWMRFNLATPRPILRDALGRIAEAFRGVN